MNLTRGKAKNKGTHKEGPGTDASDTGTAMDKKNRKCFCMSRGITLITAKIKEHRGSFF